MWINVSLVLFTLSLDFFSFFFNLNGGNARVACKPWPWTDPASWERLQLLFFFLVFTLFFKCRYNIKLWWQCFQLLRVMHYAFYLILIFFLCLPCTTGLPLATHCFRMTRLVLFKCVWPSLSSLIKEKECRHFCACFTFEKTKGIKLKDVIRTNCSCIVL